MSWDTIIDLVLSSTNLEPKNSDEQFIKLMEELGELAAELIKMKGMTAKPFDPQDLHEETADVLLCVWAFFFKLCLEDERFTTGQLTDALYKKIQAWRDKIGGYTCQTE